MSITISIVREEYRKGPKQINKKPKKEQKENKKRTSQKETTEDGTRWAKEDSKKRQMETKPKWTGGVEGDRQDRERQKRT